MHEILTMEEINEKFDGEWVFIDEVETDEQLRIVRGKVKFHDRNPDTVHEKVMASERSYFAVVFTGKPDPKMEFLL